MPFLYSYPAHHLFWSPLPYDVGATPNDAATPSHSKTSLGADPHYSPHHPRYYYPPYAYHGGSYVLTKEILKASARAHEAQKRDLVAAILQKPERERTAAEVRLVEKVFQSRKRKNHRSRERAIEVKAKVDAILEKPADNHLNRKKRKYEVII